MNLHIKWFQQHMAPTLELFCSARILIRSGYCWYLLFLIGFQRGKEKWFCSPFLKKEHLAPRRFCESWSNPNAWSEGSKSVLVKGTMKVPSFIQHLCWLVYSLPLRRLLWVLWVSCVQWCISNVINDLVWGAEMWNVAVFVITSALL